MRTTKREERLTVRLAGPLLCELKSAAARENRALADYARLVLADHAAQQVVEREQAAT